MEEEQYELYFRKGNQSAEKIGILNNETFEVEPTKELGDVSKKIIQNHNAARKLKTTLFNSFEELISSERFVVIQKFLDEGPPGGEKFSDYFKRYLLDMKEEMYPIIGDEEFQFSIKDYALWINVVRKLFEEGEHLYFTSIRRFGIMTEDCKAYSWEMSVIYRFKIAKKIKLSQPFPIYISHVLAEYLEKDKTTKKENYKKQGCCSVCGKTRKLKRCSRCKKKLYCSRGCQTKDWKIHKKNCN